MAAVNGMRVLYLGSRLPTVVQNGLELRVRNQVLATAESFPTAVQYLLGTLDSKNKAQRIPLQALGEAFHRENECVVVLIQQPAFRSASGNSH